MAKALITGGAGFIGSAFVKYLAGRHPDWTLINLDALTYAGNLENLKQLEGNPNHIFMKGDITDSALLDSLFDKYGFDYVVNLAAQTHVDRSIREPEVFINTNVMGTLHLLEAAKRFWQTGSNDGYPVYRTGVKFLQVSTDEVYGACEQGSCTEESALAPGSPYSASKAAADLLVLSYGNTYRFPFCVTRSSNNFGPNQFPEKLIPLMIGNALEGRPLPVYGDGLQVRDWLYVADHCSALDTVLTCGETGQVYNVGAGSERTNIEIVKFILKKLGKPESLIEHIKDRPGHDRRYSLDTAKLHSLGWSPRHTFEQALEATVDWYVDNAEWLSRVRSGAYMEYYQQYYFS